MDIGKYLLDEIKKCRHKMNLAKAIDYGILWAAVGGMAGIFCEAVSLFLPFYNVHQIAALCFPAGFFAGACYAVYRRADMKKAAGRLDSFGLKERMLTAYENLGKEDGFALLQRQDAFRHYEKIRGEIRISLLPDKRHTLALFIAVIATVGIGVIPSPVRERAELLHQVQEEAEAEKEELEELLETLEGVDMESLTEAQKAELQELLETMELSREELAGADSWESLSAATGRLDYKYQQAARSLEEIAGHLQNPDAAGLAGAEALAKALSKGAEQNGQQLASGGTASGTPDSGDGSGGENTGSGDENSGGEDTGSSGNGSGEENGAGGGNGADGDNGQNGGNSSGDGGSQGGGNGEGEGGFGEDGGSGSGSGGGRGTGSSDAPHDYVSIPGETADDTSLTGNKSGDQDSDYYRQQNGLAWEGDHVDYGSVIGEYTDSAYEGIANGKYPSGMETVIRDYFENLNK
ncbi:MAG: hypothetical protein HFI10_12545 [Lachnospiraceae bacterium]|jgi:hypothetical protein|nr:hypothetical protein [Lachnospiraceae bacterium]